MDIRRRDFLEVTAAAMVAAAVGSSAKGDGPYNVGLANASSYGTVAYNATRAAIASAGGLPNVNGRVVAIKPNLVAPQPCTTGTTTSPDVILGIVDELLAAGASVVKIVELPGLGKNPVPFTALGYDFFRTYDPRVSLVDMSTDPFVLTPPIPGAFNYGRGIYLPATIADPNVLVIGAPKMKTHSLCMITGSVKVMFGLYSATKNADPRHPLPRGNEHVLGIDTSLTDMLLALGPRLCFNVMDGVVAMQGNGPLPSAAFGGQGGGGTPIGANVVLAGANPLAVDFVAAKIMSLPHPELIMHLAFANKKGLGPSNVSQVTVLGDPLVPLSFQPAQMFLPPQFWPAASPSTIPASDFLSGKTVTVNAKNVLTTAFAAAQYKLEIVFDDYTNSSVPLPPISEVRLLQDWTPLNVGVNPQITWDGRDSTGALVPAGSYTVLYSTRYVSYQAYPMRVNTNSCSLVVT